MPQVVRSCRHIVEENWEPRSVVIAFGTPNEAIQPWAMASTTDSADMSGMGMAEGHRVKRSVMVSRFEKPFDGGSDTMST